MFRQLSRWFYKNGEVILLELLDMRKLTIQRLPWERLEYPLEPCVQFTGCIVQKGLHVWFPECAHEIPETKESTGVINRGTELAHRRRTLTRIEQEPQRDLRCEQRRVLLFLIHRLL